MYMMNLPVGWTKVVPWSLQQFRDTETKKTDVLEHPKVFQHVGLIINQPPGPVPGCCLSSRPTTSK